MLSAIKIMQEIGIEYMIEHDMTDILDEKRHLLLISFLCTKK